MNEKSIIRQVVRNAFLIALVSFGLLVFFFPAADVKSGGYMTVVPMVCRLALVGIIFPLCTGIFALRGQKDIHRMYTDASPKGGFRKSYWCAVGAGIFISDCPQAGREPKNSPASSQQDTCAIYRSFDAFDCFSCGGFVCLFPTF